MPAKGGKHLIAHLEFQRVALLAGTAGSVGSGGVLATNSTAVVHFSSIDRRKIRREEIPRPKIASELAEFLSTFAGP